MKHFDGQNRTTKRTIKQYPDGTREIVETIEEHNVSSRWFSANSDRQYKTATASFERQNKPLTDQATPLHRLLLMRDSVADDLSNRFSNILPMKSRK
jgi:hypothetical protein